MENVTSQNGATTATNPLGGGSDQSRSCVVPTNELEDIDRQILDFLRIINWRRIEHSLTVGKPVTAGIGVNFALCLVSAGVAYAVLSGREALPANIVPMLAISSFGLFLVLIAFRAFVLAELRRLAVQVGGRLAKDINSSRAKEFVEESHEYYARYGDAFEMGALSRLFARLNTLQSQRAKLAAKNGITSPGHELLPCRAQPPALVGLFLLTGSFVTGFIVPAPPHQTPIASTVPTAHASLVNTAPTPYRSSTPSTQVASIPQHSIPRQVESTPTPPTGSVYDRLRNFVAKHVATDSARDLADSVRDYSEHVDYFDDGKLSPEQIRADKQAYFKRWPVGRETIIGEIQLTKIAIGEWRATFGTTFRVENGLSDWIEGDATNNYEIEFIDGKPLITAQKANVTRRQKNTPAQVTNFFDDNAIAQFVAQLQRTEMSRDLDVIMRNYAPQVDYFDSGKVGHDFIRNDKADYFRRWPRIQYQVGGRVDHRIIAPQHHRVTFPLLFHVQNDAGEWADGNAENTLDLIEAGGQLKILAEKTKMIRRNKGVNPAAAVIPTPGVPIPGPTTPAPFNARRFNGRGHVYKVPELKHLVGQKLNNAWIYGDFMLKSWNGNSATFSTMAMILLPGGGSTRVDIEFAGGVFISDQANRLMNDPQMPQTGTCHIGINDPIELLWVGKINGQLVVHARSAYAFRM